MLPFLPEVPVGFARPAIVAPAAREVSYGIVKGRVDPRTARVVVTVGGVRRAAFAVPQPEEPRSGSPSLPFRVRVPIPPRNVTVRVIAFDAVGNSTSASVAPVYGLPYSGYPRTILGSEDRTLARAVRTLAEAYPGIAAVFVQDLRNGRGAAWNARARYQAASTLKLGIAIEVLRVLGAKPAPGTRLAKLLHDMLVYSDNAAANALEVWLGGSTTGGAARVTSTLRALGLDDTYVNGGYIVGTATARPIPLRIERQPPYFTDGKYTTAWDLARLHRFAHRATAGQGPLPRLPGRFTASDARYLLYLLAHVQDPGKLDRYIGDEPGVSVLHKAGWIIHARHDSGLVFWRGGAFVAVVLTWNDFGAGPSSDILAGRVAQTALDRFSDQTVSRRATHSWRVES